MFTATVELARVGPLSAEDFVAYGSGARLQMCRATVHTAQGEHRIALVLLLPEHESPLVRPSIEELVSVESAGTIPALVAGGSCEQSLVTIGLEHEEHAPLVAAAVAVMRASWGWEETTPMRIRVNDRPMVVAPRYAGTTWETTIEADSV
jgi:hypothetical protein